mmetsp:Transcript_23774/g.69801  ORF Transcript_23774/g.69801 Transcript_23774/m.69801 type:complete len:215 (+) Transcript_23774:25-669(+)
MSSSFPMVRASCAPTMAATSLCASQRTALSPIPSLALRMAEARTRSENRALSRCTAMRSSAVTRRISACSLTHFPPASTGAPSTRRSLRAMPTPRASFPRAWPWQRMVRWYSSTCSRTTRRATAGSAALWSSTCKRLMSFVRTRFPTTSGIQTSSVSCAATPAASQSHPSSIAPSLPTGSARSPCCCPTTPLPRRLVAWTGRMVWQSTVRATSS